MGDVPQPQRPVGGGRRQQAAAGVQADRLDHVRRIGDLGGGRCARRLKHAGQRIGGAGDAVRGQAQLRRQRGVLAAQLPGLDGHLAGVGVVTRRGRRRPLLVGVPGQPEYRHHQHGQRGDQALQPPGAAPLGALADLILGNCGGHELAGQRAQQGIMTGLASPVRGDRQLQAAGQGGAVPSGLLPDPGRFGDPPPGPQVVLAGVDPGPQPGPGGQQRVVGDLRVIQVHGDQPLVDEPAGQVNGTRAPPVQLGQRDDAAVGGASSATCTRRRNNCLAISCWSPGSSAKTPSAVLMIASEMPPLAW